MIIQDLKWVSRDEKFTQDVVCDVDCGFLAQAQYDRMAGQQATLPFVNLHQEPYVKVFFGKHALLARSISSCTFVTIIICYF